MHSLVEARGWIDARMDDVYGSPVGTVVDVYLDPDAQEVHWLLIRRGSSAGPLTLVPVQYSIASRAHVWVPISKDLITRAPTLEGVRSVSRGEELELCFHYGGLRRRSEILRQRPEEAVTAVPGSSVVPLPPQSTNG